MMVRISLRKKFHKESKIVLIELLLIFPPNRIVRVKRSVPAAESAGTSEKGKF